VGLIAGAGGGGALLLGVLGFALVALLRRRRAAASAAAREKGKGGRKGRMLENPLLRKGRAAPAPPSGAPPRAAFKSFEAQFS